MIDHALAGGVDVVDLVCEVAEVAAAGVRVGLIPVVRQLDLRRITVVLSKKHERETALLVVAPADLAQAEAVAEEPHRGRQVAHANHRVEVTHDGFLLRASVVVTLVTRASVVLVLFLGCATQKQTPWPKLEAEVDAICKCTDLPCVDRESADWDKLPWPDLRRADRATHERTVALSDRGNRCQLSARSKDDLGAFAQWAEKMCACTDATCANAVDDEVITWFQKMAQEPVATRIMVLLRDPIVKLDGCYAKATGVTQPPPVVLPNDIPGRVGAVAEQICACATLACADFRDNDFIEWVNMQYHRLGHDPTMGMVLADQVPASNKLYQHCHANASAKWPHTSRLRANYGIDP